MLNKVVKNTPLAASSVSPPNLLVSMGAVDAEGIAACSTIITASILGKPPKTLINKIARAGIRRSRQNTRVETALKGTGLRESLWARIEPTTISASGIVASPISLDVSKINWGRRKEVIPTISPKIKAAIALFAKLLKILAPFAGPLKMATPRVQ